MLNVSTDIRVVTYLHYKNRKQIHVYIDFNNVLIDQTVVLIYSRCNDCDSFCCLYLKFFCFINY